MSINYIYKKFKFFCVYLLIFSCASGREDRYVAASQGEVKALKEGEIDKTPSINLQSNIILLPISRSGKVVDKARDYCVMVPNNSKPPTAYVPLFPKSFRHAEIRDLTQSWAGLKPMLGFFALFFIGESIFEKYRNLQWSLGQKLADLEEDLNSRRNNVENQLKKHQEVQKTFKISQYRS